MKDCGLSARIVNRCAAVVVAALLSPMLVCFAQEQPTFKPHPVPLDAKNSEKTEYCLQCHNFKAKFTHSALSSGCSSCHVVRVKGEETEVGLVAADSRAVCLTCHSDKGGGASIHPPVGQSCVTCHSPHSSDNRNQLLKPASGTGNENLCLTCHDKGGKVPEKGSRHAALDMGCDSCHVTHKGGDPAKNEFAFHLKKPSPALCLDCHDVKDKSLVLAHRDQPVAAADCTRCHDAHQSSSPKLMNANLHAPFAEKSCDVCHQPAKAGKVVLNEGGKRVLCYTCHADLQKQVEQSKTQHAVFGMTDTCTTCHNPHASRTPKLMQSSEGQVCATCHEKSTAAVRHGPYDQGLCADCHDAHGTELPTLLRADGNELCRGCHVQGQSGVKVEGQIVTLPWKYDLSAHQYEAAPKIGLDRGGETGHPMLRHPLSGKNLRAKSEQPELSCLSCHQAHSSNVSNLMPAKVKDSIQLCEQCHK